jgi:hypothetical protein
MRNLFSRIGLLTSQIVIALLIGIPGYSQKKPAAALPAGSVKLQYNYLSDKSIKYQTTSKVVQDMDVNGQSMLVNANTLLKCNVKLASKNGENLKLEIKIDTMAQSLDTPQGATGGEVTDAKYKVFTMVITPYGKPKDLSEAAKVVLTLPGSGPSDASQTFLDFFPIIPAAPVKPGDKWVARDTANTKTATMTRYMPVESNYTFEGTEKFNGVDCAKITAALTGSMKMTNQAQGMDISTNGIFTGTKTLYFDIKDGYFINETTVTKMIGKIEITNQGMSFPVVMTITATNEMVK